MKTNSLLWICPLLLTATITIVNGQSSFNPAAYMQFLENNKTLTADQLLTNNPPKTVYYSSRTNPANLWDIPWYDTINSVLDLTDTEEELLGNNFFMVSERLKSTNWIEPFITIYNNDLPLFLSTDFILHTLHNSYDAILQTVEWQFLEPNLKIFLAALYDAYPSLYNKYKDDVRLSDALADVDLYVAVARSLANDQEYLPQYSARDKYDEVMLGVEAEKMTSMGLFTIFPRTRKIDFSQFKPRGHYNKIIYTPSGEINLEAYFRAMMWLGRIDFLLTAPPENPWESDWTVEELLRMKLGATLLNELLYSCGKKDLLDTHEKIIGFLVGPADNLTPDELYGLTSALLSTPTDLFNNDIYDQFDDTLNSSDDYGQKIMSNFFLVDPYSADPGQLPVSFKLMGQKFLIDSYVTSEVVYDRIIWDNEKVYRGLPDPLDIMSVMGNEDAMALMKEEMEKYKYAYKISSLKCLVDAYDEDFWEQSLYNTWLSVIRELNPPASSAHLPYFMKTTAWHHEKINTQLTSWAALRHDNILYGKQSYTGGTACSYPYTYVEPYPEFYERLQLFAQHASVFFEQVFDGASLSSKDYIIEYYSRYADIMGYLKSIAQKELDGTPVNEEEIAFLKTMINSFMASGPCVTGWFNDLFFSPDLGMNPDFIVADIHTQPTDQAGFIVGHVYHVGNGYINNGVFIAPNPLNPGQLMAFAGPVSSFHYEVTRDFYRFTDQEWDEKFMSGDSIPARPDWIALYMAGPEGSALPDGRELKGIVYDATGLDPSPVVPDVDYLLTFPNPAKDNMHLRFVLNQTNIVTVELYNANGSLVSQPYCNVLTPAEHDIQVDLTGLQEGLYMVKMRAGEKTFLRKVVVR
ncbi:MAG: DUF3160 domain-containing protein [Bacteroidales bacterium]|nr:DUF3160 domain-containing protein [Bacteroidales bacterium]